MKPDLQHVFAVGGTGSGKSELALSINAARLRELDRPVYVIEDLHGPTAEMFACFFISRGLPFVIDTVAETDHVPGLDILAPSTNQDAGQAEAENREQVSAAIGFLLKSRGLVDASRNPIIQHGLDTVLNCYIHRRTPYPFSLLRDCLYPQTDSYRHVLENTTQPEFAFRFELLAKRLGRDFALHCEPVIRILNPVFDSPQVRARDRPDRTLRIDELLNAGISVIISGKRQNNLSQQDYQFIAGVYINNLIRAAYNWRLRRRVVCILEEANSSGSLDVNVARALPQTRKMNLEFQIILQNFLSLPPEVQDSLLSNCWYQFWGKQVNHEAAAFAARTCGTHLLDPMRVHHIETRMEHTGLFDIETLDTESKWQSGDPLKKNFQKGKTTGKHYVNKPIYREKDVLHYQTLNDQILLKQQEIMNQQVGEWTIKSGDGVTPHPVYIPMVELPFEGLLYQRHPPITLRERKLWLYIQEHVKTRPEWQPSQVLAQWRSAARSTTVTSPNTASAPRPSSNGSASRARFRKSSTSSTTASRSNGTERRIESRGNS